MLEPHGIGRQPRGERGDELAHAPGQAHEQAPARAAGRRGRRLSARLPEPEDEAALASLQLHEAGHRREQAQLVGVGGVDSRDERLGDALERLTSKTAAHERAQALVAAAAARQDHVERHPQLARPREEARSHSQWCSDR